MFRYLLLLSFMLPLAVSAGEDPSHYVVGDTIEPITLQDQHDISHSVDESTKWILFTTGMKGGGVIREAIGDQAPDYLEERDAIFLSNISGMPGLIARFIALPRMRSHEYSIVLDREGNVTEKFPSQSNSATLIHLDKLKIKAIYFTKDSDDVSQVIN